MKDLLYESELATTRCSFLKQLTALSAVFAGARSVWGTMRAPLTALAAQANKVINWSLKPGPLLTRWATQVNAQTPHPEYPYPQLARKDWLNLNGLWEYQPGAAAGEAPPFGQAWKFVLEKPDGQWASKESNDSHWSQGMGAFGNNDNHSGTPWTTPDLWLRRSFHPGILTPAQLRNLVITEFHEGNIEIFINGVQTYAQHGMNGSYEGRYEHRPMGQPVRQAVLSNADNVIAVHCHAISDKQYFDAGLSIRTPSLSQPPLVVTLA